MTTANLSKLQNLLNELFLIDQAELDFGIYRIMGAKREEIQRFLQDDLLPQVRTSLGTLETSEQTETRAELATAIAGAHAAGFDPDQSPKVKTLREKLAQDADPAALEDEVFSHLYTLFRRYYKDGDFLSLRRYKKDVYALPYEGEEVKLYWANADQYYIKSSEYFRDYTFTLSNGRRVHFKLAEADTELNNNKAANGKERRFVLAGDLPLIEENGELLMRFEYRPDAEKQPKLNDQTLARIKSAPGFESWQAALNEPAATDKNAARTLLEKHLHDYTARNSFDYFIHKDLGGFLRRELDFYTKNEIMLLDDIEEQTAPRVEQFLSKIKAVRRIAHKIIDMLAQVENFQKKLWLKKKFVVETNYCVTLDRVPQALYAEVATNDAQRAEWLRLFAIDEIAGDLIKPAYTAPLTVEFLNDNPFLLVDTRFFSADFTARLLESFNDLDAQTDGLLIHSENFQALNLLQVRYKEQVKCIYIDPPYNTDSSEIMYKNGYKSSSWITMINNRLPFSTSLLQNNGILCATIDDQQQKELTTILSQHFGDGNLLGTVSIRINPSGRITLTGFAQSHEYAIFLGKSQDSSISKIPRTDIQSERFNQSDGKGTFEWRNFRREGSSSERVSRPRRFFPIYVNGASLRIPQLQWQESSKSYLILDQPNQDETAIYPFDGNDNERVWRWGLERIQREMSEIVPKKNPQGKLQLYYKYRPNEEGVLPPTIWVDKKYSATEYGTAAIKDLFGSRNEFSFPKSIHAVEDCVRISIGDDEYAFILDYFAGSGTTGHAVINLNREDGGTRKYILVEMGGYFDAVTKPRIQKVIYSKDWRDGKPVSRAGSSHIFKYMRLESYEDTLNNLDLRRTPLQAALLAEEPELREDYMLRYMLDIESRGSASLLNIECFERPFDYTLKIATGSAGKTRPVAVDLVETFNYLLGMRVQRIESFPGIKVVRGRTPDDQKALIIWRDMTQVDNAALERFVEQQDFRIRDNTFDLIYVNGDTNLENMKQGDEIWKVRLTEEAFQRLMFDVQDV